MALMKMGGAQIGHYSSNLVVADYELYYAQENEDMEAKVAEFQKTGKITLYNPISGKHEHLEPKKIELKKNGEAYFKEG